jgi:hypothetical protein
MPEQAPSRYFITKTMNCSKDNALVIPGSKAERFSEL